MRVPPQDRPRRRNPSSLSTEDKAAGCFLASACSLVVAYYLLCAVVLVSVAVILLRLALGS
jgi:hypothetical protein